MQRALSFLPPPTTLKHLPSSQINLKILMGRAGGRINSYHSAKSALVGHAATHQAPAWKASNLPQGSGSSQAHKDGGSKVLLSNLPPDVSEDEIIDLMKKTIGPVNAAGSFMVYTNKGFPRGVSVVAFVKAGDAAKARERYDGKVIDGKRAIKLELVVSHVEPPAPRPPAPPTAPKASLNLQQRIGPKLYADLPKTTTTTQHALPSRPQPKAAKKGLAQIPQAKPQARAPGALPVITAAPKKVKQKKGAKRVRKSIEDLDREMEDYIAARPGDAYGLMSA